MPLVVEENLVHYQRTAHNDSVEAPVKTACGRSTTLKRRLHVTSNKKEVTCPDCKRELEFRRQASEDFATRDAERGETYNYGNAIVRRSPKKLGEGTMKICLSELRQMIREAAGRRFSLPGAGGGGLRPRRYDPATDTVADVMRAAVDAFHGVAPDLGIDDVADPAFLDWIGDALTDAGVPVEVRQQVKQKLARGQTR